MPAAGTIKAPIHAARSARRRRPGSTRRRLGASEMCVSHAIVHGLVGQGSEASDEVVVVHNVYIVAGSQGDMGSVEGR